MGAILEQRECALGIFKVVDLRGQFWGLLGVHLRMFVS